LLHRGATGDKNAIYFMFITFVLTLPQPLSRYLRRPPLSGGAFLTKKINAYNVVFAISYQHFVAQ
jgi:hypothetical protein